jgi:UDP-N-acetylmuramoyl-tripeptide--D-alanyl-D-alanine ligase
VKPCSFDHIRRVTLSRWEVRGEREFRGGVSTDSRRIREGDLFVAIQGEKFNGNKFVMQAVSAGASGVLIDQTLNPDVRTELERTSATIMQTDQSVRALGRLAASYRREIRSKVIAVGGSNGKTTTKQIIHSLLSQKFSGVASPRSFNNNIGLPLTLLSVEPQHDYVILEVGTNALGEIAALGAMAIPDIAVITGVGLEHLEQLMNLNAVAVEEASLARFTTDDGMLFFNKSAPELLHALRLSKVLQVTVGFVGAGADIEVTPRQQDITGISFEINGRSEFHLSLLGWHNAINAALAIGVARRMGLSEEELRAGLAGVKASSMRLEPQTLGTHWILNDAYNANPSSTEVAMRTFAELTLPMVNRRRPRKVVVLADMLELGTSAGEHHLRMGQLAAELKLDGLVAIGSLASWAAIAAEKCGMTTVHFTDVQQALDGRSQWLGTGDAILLKGSRGMHLEDLVKGLSVGKLPQTADYV